MIMPNNTKTINEIIEEKGYDCSTEEMKNQAWKEELPHAKAIIVHGD